MKSSYLLVFITACGAVSGDTKNVCKNLNDYYTRDTNPNCWYDPNVNASAYNLANNQGYPLETYKAITDDSYILTVFRIPPKDKKHCKGIVFLQHPAIASASIWMDLGNESLAFILRDAGYDIWLGNFRGTLYSSEHVHLSPAKEPHKYWNFSFHEMGIYDLPAQFEVVKRNTDFKKMYYIGHSLGTITAYVYSSLLPQNASSYIDTFITLSPIAFTRHAPAPIIFASRYADLIMYIGDLFPALLSGPTYDGLLHHFIEHFCFNINIHLCVATQQLMAGKDPKYFTPERLPVSIYQNFAGLSLKTVVHYFQMLKVKGCFQMYDYGAIKNKGYYNSTKPPMYPVENINVSMHFVYGGNDAVAGPEDVLYFYNKKLPKQARSGIHKINAYNHFDFHYASNLKNMLYEHILNLIEKLSKHKKPNN